jgi:hypothetical protein
LGADHLADWTERVPFRGQLYPAKLDRTYPWIHAIPQKVLKALRLRA